MLPLHPIDLTNTFTDLIQAMKLLRSKLKDLVLCKRLKGGLFEANHIFRQLYELSFSSSRTTRCPKYEIADIDVIGVHACYLCIIISATQVNKSS